MAILWGLSILDFQRHAVDELAEHPIGCYRAQCGHLADEVVSLSPDAFGDRCAECTGMLAAAR